MDRKPNPSNTFVPELLTIEPVLERPGLLARLTSRSTGAIVQSAVLEATRDRCQAQLAKTTMEHLGVLSAMEAQLSASTPQSAVRYQKIVDAYTIGAIRRLVEGGDDFGY